MLIGGCGCIATLGCQPQATPRPASQTATSESSSPGKETSPGKPPIRGRFRVAELPFDIKQVKATLRERKMGQLEIKHRGLQLDPDLLRKRLRVPGDNRATLIIVGAEDPATTPEMSRIIHAEIDGSELAILPDAAHLANIEQTDAFNDVLMNFLARH